MRKFYKFFAKVEVLGEYLGIRLNSLPLLLTLMIFPHSPTASIPRNKKGPLETLPFLPFTLPKPSFFIPIALRYLPLVGPRCP
jgi:hypothetical protein